MLLCIWFIAGLRTDYDTIQFPQSIFWSYAQECQHLLFYTKTNPDNISNKTHNKTTLTTKEMLDHWKSPINLQASS